MTDSADQIALLDKVESEAQKWWEHSLKLIPGINHPNALSGHDGFNTRSVSKEAFAKIVFQGIKIVYQQHNIIKEIRGQAQVLKSEHINCQSAVIKLQQELISAKDDQAAGLQATVTASVENAVVKSFSDVVQANPVSNNASSTAIPHQETLKSVVKHVIEEEDRSKNVILFGVDETDDKQLHKSVSQIFEELSEKPRYEAVRLGMKKNGKAPRPVKVSFSSSVCVQQILRKARLLRKSKTHKSVFVAPDRCAEERALQKSLVMDLKKKRQEEKDKRHFIKGGTIQSVSISED